MNGFVWCFMDRFGNMNGLLLQVHQYWKIIGEFWSGLLGFLRTVKDKKGMEFDLRLPGYLGKLQLFSCSFFFKCHSIKKSPSFVRLEASIQVSKT